MKGGICLVEFLLSQSFLLPVVCSSYSDKDGRMVETEGAALSVDVRGFRGAAIVVKVKKRPGMEKVNLLEAEGQPGSESGGREEGPGGGIIWDTLSR